MDASISILIAVMMTADEVPSVSWPRDYSVARDEASGRLVLSTPYYEVVHDLKRGGAICAIRYSHGRAENLLVRRQGHFSHPPLDGRHDFRLLRKPSGTRSPTAPMPAWPSNVCAPPKPAYRSPTHTRPSPCPNDRSTFVPTR